ncbi:MAG: hypothetical protein IJW82_02610 [Clostridia bacterium]|nr:hypothetical protein [Clostridia bacterium]
MKKEYSQNRFFELSQNACNRWIDTSTNFLNITELAEFSNVKNKLPSNHFLIGGIENAERKMVVFSMFSEINELDFVSYLKLTCKDEKFSEELKHRNYLGAIMSLGIERDTIGDILIDCKTGYVICTKGIADYIKNNLVSVGKTTVNIEVVDKLPSYLKIKLKDILISSASNRIDLIISKLYGTSRKESNELFNSNSVYVNDKLCLNNSYNLKPNDIVSVSGYGRFTFIEQQSITKKGNFVYLIKKYV